MTQQHLDALDAAGRALEAPTSGHYEYELLEDAKSAQINALIADGWDMQYCTPVGLHGTRAIFAAMFRRWVDGDSAATEQTKDDTQELPVIEEAPDATPTPQERLTEAAGALDDPEADDAPAVEPIRTVSGTVIVSESDETPAATTKEDHKAEIINESNRRCAEAMRKTFDHLQSLRAEQAAYRADHAPIFARIESKVGA